MFLKLCLQEGSKLPWFLKLSFPMLTTQERLIFLERCDSFAYVLSASVINLSIVCPRTNGLLVSSMITDQYEMDILSENANPIGDCCGCDGSPLNLTSACCYRTCLQLIFKLFYEEGTGQDFMTLFGLKDKTKAKLVKPSNV